MKVNEIKHAIKALPDNEIEPLLKWLREYYDGEVWDRQIAADIERLGEEGFLIAMGINPENPLEGAGDLFDCPIFTDEDRAKVKQNLKNRGDADPNRNNSRWR